jgi:osmotically-inducible protein OsmY
MVAAKKGVVTIGGSVRHELQKDVAVSIVRNIDGVRAVESSLDRE